jgi:hypothetical protein
VDGSLRDNSGLESCSDFKRSSVETLNGFIFRYGNQLKVRLISAIVQFEILAKIQFT